MIARALKKEKLMLCSKVGQKYVDRLLLKSLTVMFAWVGTADNTAKNNLFFHLTRFIRFLQNIFI